MQKTSKAWKRKWAKEEETKAAKKGIREFFRNTAVNNVPGHELCKSLWRQNWGWPSTETEDPSSVWEQFGGENWLLQAVLCSPRVHTQSNALTQLYSLNKKGELQKDTSMGNKMETMCWSFPWTTALAKLSLHRVK